MFNSPQVRAAGGGAQRAGLGARQGRMRLWTPTDGGGAPARVVHHAAKQGAASESVPVPRICAARQVLVRLAQDPRTRVLLDQPAFRSMLSDVQANPANMSKYLQNPQFQLVSALGPRPPLSSARARVARRSLRAAS